MTTFSELNDNYKIYGIIIYCINLYFIIQVIQYYFCNNLNKIKYINMYNHINMYNDIIDGYNYNSNDECNYDSDDDSEDSDDSDKEIY